MSKQQPQVLYDPSEIRTSNMLPDRSSDVWFDHENEPSLTQQSMADECDINKLMDRYKDPELIPHVNRFRGDYFDLGESIDYQAAIEHVRNAESMFMSLPADIRKQFNNDAGQFLDFANNPENGSELVRMGLATERAIPTQTPPQNSSKTPSEGVKRKTKMVEVPIEEGE